VRMDILTPATFSIRPAEFNDIADFDTPGRWRLYGRSFAFMRKIIVALNAQGALVGYCAFEVEEQSRLFRVYVIESHQPGAGRELLDALKLRASRIVADTVLAEVQDWWERRGFVQFAPSDEEGTVGYFEWWREDESPFDGLPLAPLWEQQTVERLFRETQDQRRLEKAMQRMVKPNTLPMVSVPAAFVEAVSQALAAGHVAPEAVTALQSYLAEIDQIQSEPVRRNVVWFADALQRLVALGAPPTMLKMLTELMQDYVFEVERRGGLSGKQDNRND
jgi:predicted RNA binding protein with dsRBD fold (UPF0201 family)